MCGVCPAQELLVESSHKWRSAVCSTAWPCRVQLGRVTMAAHKHASDAVVEAGRDSCCSCRQGAGRVVPQSLVPNSNRPERQRAALETQRRVA